MNQDTDPALFHLSSTALQEHPTCSCPPRGDFQRLDEAKSSNLPLQLPLFLDFPKPKKRGIDRVLGRLSRMEFPGKGYVEDYMRYQYRRGFKFSTLKGTLEACELFLSFLGDDGKGSLEQITRQDIEAFVEHELDRGLKILSVQTRLTCVYAFLRFLYERGVVEAELLVRKIRLRLPDPLPKAINPDDVKRLLCVVDHVRNRAMILVLLRTGMRIGELLGIRVNDVNLEERKIAIWEAQKNLVGRVVYVSDDAAHALDAWFKKRDPNKGLLFYGRGYNPLSYQGARVMFGKYLKKAGLDHKGYTLHCLRHTFASEVLNAGMPLEAVQTLLGHSNAEVTRRYARLTDKTREEEYFKAMEIIERGGINGDYRLDS
jgi:integrase/recombinase XerD